LGRADLNETGTKKGDRKNLNGENSLDKNSALTGVIRHAGKGTNLGDERRGGCSEEPYKEEKLIIRKKM